MQFYDTYDFYHYPTLFFTYFYFKIIYQAIVLITHFHGLEANLTMIWLCLPIHHDLGFDLTMMTLFLITLSLSLHNFTSYVEFSSESHMITTYDITIYPSEIHLVVLMV